MLRYFERKSAREMAQTLGISDEAAQKRVSRAVERLREFFAKRGVTVGASGLVVVISANAVQAAPAGLAVTISTAAALAGTITTATIATHTTMNWLNLKSITAILAATIVAGTGTHLVQQRETNRLRTENQNLITQQQKLTGERDSALVFAAGNKDELERLQKNQSDLLRLRGEVGMLRKQNGELEKLHDKKPQLQAISTDTEQPLQPEGDLANEQVPAADISKLTAAKLFGQAMRLYSGQNEQQFPTSFDQIIPYLGGKTNPVVNDLSQFEIIFQGTTTNLPSPGSIIVIREKEAWQTADGKWARAYGFADAHSEIQYAANGDFTVWEKEHMAPLPPDGK